MDELELIKKFDNDAYYFENDDYGEIISISTEFASEELLEFAHLNNIDLLDKEGNLLHLHEDDECFVKSKEMPKFKIDHWRTSFSREKEIPKVEYLTVDCFVEDDMIGVKEFTSLATDIIIVLKSRYGSGSITISGNDCKKFLDYSKL